MDDMKNDMDDALRGNENRARIETAGVYNRMTPCDGSGSAVAHPANDLPMPIRGDAPENPDPHSHGRLSNNLSKKPFERPGSHYTEEIRRRVHGRDVKYR
jgi:hypothetical protein